MKALILAGGKGTRLRPLTYAIAKQLVPVANRPILFYAYDSLFQAGIRDFGIIISPETGEDIQSASRYWQSLQSEAVELTFILQDSPAGLAHAVATAKSYLGQDDFIMYLGDNLIDANLAGWVQKFQENPETEAAILLKPVDHPERFGVAKLNEAGSVIELMEKPKNPPSNLALVGVYLFRPSIFDAISRIQPSWRGELEITDAIQRLITDGKTVHSHIHEGWWLDTGKKDDMLAANQTVLNMLKPTVQTAVSATVDSQSILLGAITIGEDSQIENCQITGPVVIGNSCHLKNLVIGPHTSIGDTTKAKNVHIENSVVLAGCTLADLTPVLSECLIGKQCEIKGQAASTSEKSGRLNVTLVDDSQILYHA